MAPARRAGIEPGPKLAQQVQLGVRRHIAGSELSIFRFAQHFAVLVHQQGAEGSIAVRTRGAGKLDGAAKMREIVGRESHGGEGRSTATRIRHSPAILAK